MVKYQSEIVWPANGGTKLSVEVTHDDLRFVEFYNVNAEAIDTISNETVAILQGALLRRPQACFYEEADAVSQELQEVSVTFCTSHGTASRVKHPKLQADDPCICGTRCLRRSYAGSNSCVQLDGRSRIGRRQGRSFRLSVLGNVLVRHW